MFTMPVMHRGGGDIDPYFQNVLLLLHGEGSNGSTTFVDSSKYGHTQNILWGTPTISTAQAKEGTGSIYAGAGAHNIGSNISTAFQSAEEWTWECWYRPVARASYHGLCYTNNSNLILLLRSPLNGGSYQLLMTVNGFLGLGGATVIPLDTWTHLAVTRKLVSGSTYKVTFWVNGVEDASSSSGYGAGTAMSPNGWNLGRTDSAGFSGINAYVDEYRITLGVARYDANFTPPRRHPDVGPDPKLSLLMHFDGADGATAPAAFIDKGVANRTFAVAGGARLESDQSKFGGTSIYLPTNASGLSCGSFPEVRFGLEDFTVDFWLYLTAAPTGGSDMLLLGCRDAAGANRWSINLTTSNYIPGFLVDSSNKAQGSIGEIPLNTWTHLAWTRAGDQLRFFKNGTLRSTSADATNFNHTSSFRIGQQVTFLNFAPYYLDELRIVKGRAMWTSSFTPPAAPYSPA